MSEYQYYEFQAIDQPLSERQMQTLRAYSTRARITPTSFVNHYEWGNFKGNANAWMEKYFDAFLYVANWGTHVFMFRLPSKVLPLKVAWQYCPGNAASAREKSGKVIITLVSEEEPDGDWDTGEGWLASLVPVRAEIARGDLRALYLAWLLCAQGKELRGNALEPPVPARLGDLSASLRSLAAFLRIDGHLLASASAGSADAMDASLDRKALSRWVAALPPREKNKVLLTLMAGEGAHSGNELLARYQQERAGASPGGVSGGHPSRTVQTLMQGAAEYRRMAAEKAAEERAHRQREAMAAREKYLDGLVGRESTLWVKVERLIAEKQPRSYDQALKVLLDLRDLAARTGKGDNFRQRLDALRAAHARKLTFLDKLKRAGL